MRVWTEMLRADSMAGAMVELRLHDDDAGQRLDRFLRKLLRAAPLALVHRLIRTGAARVDGARATAAQRLAAGDVVELDVSDARFAALRGDSPPAAPAPAQNTPAPATAFRDAHLWVVDKPGGLAVHGGSGQRDDLTRRVRHALGTPRAQTFRPAPAHRIDRGTSGLVAFGLTAHALRALSATFRDGAASKTYLALTTSVPRPEAGVVELPLDATDRGARAARTRPDAAGGRHARTQYRTLAAGDGIALLELHIDTGRTHQIRAHLAALGCPLLGDLRYGGRRAPGLARHRIALHATRLQLAHPVSAELLDVTSELHADLHALLPGQR